MKKTLATTFLFLALVPGLALAHEVASDGPISTIMHIDPSDENLKAGIMNHFTFEFSDKDNKFMTNECECLVTVLKDDKNVLTQPLSRNQIRPMFDYAFPMEGNYHLVLSGNPVQTAQDQNSSFHSFKITYDIAVAANPDANKESGSQQKEPPNPYLENSGIVQSNNNNGYLFGIGILVVLIAGATVVIVKKRK